MRMIEIHKKQLPVPSFFQVMNYGGGFQDKTREVVYADLTRDVPLLLNYFYMNNNYTYKFHSKYFDNIDKYNTVGDMFNDIRNKMITRDGNILSTYPKVDYDFNERVVLLDSGASNIVKLIAKEVGYDKERFCERLLEDMVKYYDFADRYKFDIVVGFDLGGKYTFKDGETKDERLIKFYDSIDKDEINFMLMQKAVDYLKAVDNYYPKVLATIHGRTPYEYENYTAKTLALEEEKGYSFWGFALGGVASSRGIDPAWYAGIDFSGTKKKHVKNAIIPAQASYIVHNMVGDRPIHALGSGGFANIPMNYFLGATSFDAATPARRVGDGNDLSAEYFYCLCRPPKTNFSKILLGGYNINMEKMQGDFDYYKICDVPDDYMLCGCDACRYIGYVAKLKELYSKKKEDAESHYCARQIMNTHSINLHTFLCRRVAMYDSFEAFVADNPSVLNDSLKKVYEQMIELWNDNQKDK